jgi:prophage antirepressor-like protein
MDHPSTNAGVRLLPTPAFHTHDITTIELAGRPLVLPQSISVALAYADRNSVMELITQKWSDEFVPNVHMVTLTGEALRPLKDADIIDKRSPSLTLLTESGLWLVLMLTNKPAGKALRQWLSTEALPMWNAGKALLAPAAAPALSAEPHHHLQLLLDLHTCGEIAPAAFARRIGAMLKADDLDVAARGDLVDELVRMSQWAPAAQADRSHSHPPLQAAPAPARPAEAPPGVPTGGAVGTFVDWLMACCVVRRDLVQSSAALYASYLAFAEKCGDVALGKTSWQHCMKQQRFVPTRIGRASSRAWQGVALFQWAPNAQDSLPQVDASAEPEMDTPVEAPPPAWHGKVLAWMQGRKTATILQIATQGLGLKPAEISKAIQMQIAAVLREAGFHRQKQGAIVSWSRQPARVLS